MAKAKKKAARGRVEKAARTTARKPVKVSRRKAAKKVAKASPAKPKTKVAKKAVQRPAPKAKAAKQVAKRPAPKAKRAVGSATPTARPVKTGIASRAMARDENAGIRIAATAPERVTQAPRPQPAPLRMPFVVPVERPIAPLELRPAPLFERELFPHDDEE